MAQDIRLLCAKRFTTGSVDSFRMLVIGPFLPHLYPNKILFHDVTAELIGRQGNEQFREMYLARS